MPIYKVISSEVLEEFRKSLENMIVSQENCFSGLAYFTLRLAEYLQIGFYFKEYAEGEEECKNIKIVRGTFINSDKKGRKGKFEYFSDEECRFILRLKDFGDTLRHDMYELDDMLSKMYFYLSSDHLASIIKKISGDSLLYQLFKNGFAKHKVIEIFKYGDVLSKLSVILKVKLISNEDSDTLENVLNSVINETGCSRDIVLRAMFNVLKDEYVLGSKR